jgi:release factor glutamine methyltransferase
MQLNVQEARESIRKQLAPASDSPSLDAQVLLAHILNKTRAWVMAHPEASLNARQEESLHIALNRLEKGEPLPYILGHWEFYGLDFIVSPAVLIPRPETELLVDYASSWLKVKQNRQLAADIGTGSGCIAVALAANIHDLKLVAADISAAALDIARQNIARHNLTDRIFPVQIDLIQGILPPAHERFDLICANLPYIPQEKLDALKSLRWEPEIALNGGITGTELIQRMLRDVPHILAPGGLLLMEIEASLGVDVCSLVQNALPTAEIQLKTDLAGHDRLVIAKN